MSTAHPSPQFAELNRIEEELLVARLQATRSAITHAGEKGRALEHHVTTLLRLFLPPEYGLSTGFIVYHTDSGPQLSPQLDVIIYDALRSGPLIRLETCDVFPLEAVYACVEVKANVTSYAEPPCGELVHNSMEAILVKAQAIRKMRERRYWVPHGTVTAALVAHKDWMPIRFYAFAFELTGPAENDIAKLAQAMANESKRIGGAMLHGLLIANQGLIGTRAVDVSTAQESDYHNIDYTTEYALGTFKNQLVLSLNRFPRPQSEWSAAIDQYQNLDGRWSRATPRSS